MKTFHGLGLMSGTSLDGLDIAYVTFEHSNKWRYSIQHSETIRYDHILKKTLHECYHYSAFEFQRFHNQYGHWLGKQAVEFINRYQIKPQFIASHGHTIFHDPALGITTQIGSGANIYANTGITTVCDFRTVDVASGGQGAPLVPKGDKDLFSEYEYLLNLGGIANITRNNDSKAFDITVANMGLNYYAQQLGAEYDTNGDWARSGKLNEALLRQLNILPFFSQAPPKSLGREFFEREFLPILNRVKATPQDALHTLCKHIGLQIKGALNNLTPISGRMIVTGGGALNNFLIDSIKEACTAVEVVVPDRKTVEFKEALIFAYLGLLRLLNQSNCLRSVTGAERDVIGGAVYGEIWDLER